MENEFFYGPERIVEVVEAFVGGTSLARREEEPEQSDEVRRHLCPNRNRNRPERAETTTQVRHFQSRAFYVEIRLKGFVRLADGRGGGRRFVVRCAADRRFLLGF